MLAVRPTSYTPDPIEGRPGFVAGLAVDGAVQCETGCMNRMATIGDVASRCTR